MGMVVELLGVAPVSEVVVAWTVTTYPPELLVVAVIVTVPSELTVLWGRPVRGKDGVSPVSLILRAATVVEVAHRGPAVVSEQELPTVVETTRLARTPSPVPVTR